MENNNDEMKQFFIWLVITIVWWISPLDDTIEAALTGPAAFLALSDEIVFTIITAFHGFRQFLGAKAISGAKYYVGKATNKVITNTEVANKVNKVLDSTIDKKMTQLGNSTPLQKSKPKNDKSVDDMNLF